MEPTKQQEFELEIHFDDAMLTDIAIKMASDFGIVLTEESAHALVQDELVKMVGLAERMQDALQVSFRDQLFRHMLEATKEGGM